MYRFNKKPEKSYMDLVTTGLVSNDPQSTLVGAIFTEGARRRLCVSLCALLIVSFVRHIELAVFLCEEPGISRTALGDFLGSPSKTSEMVCLRLTAAAAVATSLRFILLRPSFSLFRASSPSSTSPEPSLA